MLGTCVLTIYWMPPVVEIFCAWIFTYIGWIWVVVSPSGRQNIVLTGGVQVVPDVHSVQFFLKNRTAHLTYSDGSELPVPPKCYQFGLCFVVLTGKWPRVWAHCNCHQFCLDSLLDIVTDLLDIVALRCRTMGFLYSMCGIWHGMCTDVQCISTVAVYPWLLHILAVLSVCPVLYWNRCHAALEIALMASKQQIVCTNLRNYHSSLQSMVWLWLKQQIIMKVRVSRFVQLHASYKLHRGLDQNFIAWIFLQLVILFLIHNLVYDFTYNTCDTTMTEQRCLYIAHVSLSGGGGGGVILHVTICHKFCLKERCPKVRFSWGCPLKRGLAGDVPWREV